MTQYRALSERERAILEKQGCEAQSWQKVSVKDGFEADKLLNVRFLGSVRLGVYTDLPLGKDHFQRYGIRNALLEDVTIGDDVVIDNVTGIISRYDIGSNTIIRNVGDLVFRPQTLEKEPLTIPVLSEAGSERIFVTSRLSSPLASLMLRHSHDKEMCQKFAKIAEKSFPSQYSERGFIGGNCLIANTLSVENCQLQEGTRIENAARLSNVRCLSLNGEAPVIGSGVIMDSCTVLGKCQIDNFSRLSRCFVSENTRITNGFLAENCVITVNCHLSAGEAVSCFLGPFTVSHHKSTLLIGAAYSFYNAGSNTNFSNHAYKMGPIHKGELRRGAKTASSSHVLLPATIGGFSMIMGKVSTHPDTAAFPFSYVFGEGLRTRLLPAKNLFTVGTLRDTGKWQVRDGRSPSGRLSPITLSWLNPKTATALKRATELLQRLLNQSQDGQIAWQGCYIKRSDAQQAIHLYTLGLKLFMGETLQKTCHNNILKGQKTEDYTDLGGLILPESEAEKLAQLIKSGEITSQEQAEDSLNAANDQYNDFLNNAFFTLSGCEECEVLDTPKRESIMAEYQKAKAEIRGLIEQDAAKEFALGDVDEETYKGFLSELGNRL